MSATQPSTPYYFYEEDSAIPRHSASSSIEAPPSYTSSSASHSPPSSVSSPRSSSGGDTRQLPSSANPASTIVDIFSQAASSAVGSVTGGRSSSSQSRSRSSLSGTEDGEYAGSCSESEFGGAEASARTLRFGATFADAGDAFSRLSSRAASPAPVHHHIHHHYHHSSSTASSSSGTASAKGKERALQITPRTPLEKDLPDDDHFANHHYRSGPLARKLGVLSSRDSSFTDLPSLLNGAGSPALGASSHRRRAGWKSPRRKEDDDFGTMFDTSVSLRNRRRFSAFVPPSVLKSWQRFLRHPFVPTQPLTILFALGLFASFAFSVTTFMYHILSTDKAPRPWRAYCQEQRPFPHELADSLNPVDVFVGVFSVDAAYERRHLIRSTYLAHSKPIDPMTGRPGHNVQVKFILGRPRKHHSRRIALEMETYNDIVVLDMKENMNQGKTHAFFKWANENATVPIYYRPPHGAKKIGKLTSGNDVDTLNVGFKKADYVVKADDDSFLVLSELERHLRVAPRENMYWGYLIRNLFMGGECYALSSDLVNYVATYPALEAYTTGAEDKRVAKWMRLHPNASSINWITERCYVYDHPKAGTTYSHGFLFPDEVERVRAEAETGISAAEKARRGGELSDAWSTVSKWKKGYTRPKAEMTMEEEVEALVEGGGRWTGLDGWTNKVGQKDVVRWDSITFESTDKRIRGLSEHHDRATAERHADSIRSDMAFGKYNRMPNSLLRDPGELDIRPQHAKRGLAFWRRDDTTMQSTSLVESLDSEVMTSASANSSLSPSGQPSRPVYQQPDSKQHIIGSAPNYKQGWASLPDPQIAIDAARRRPVPIPTVRYDAATMSVRERRFLGLPFGGTVVVHYLKRNEWFLETALALLGRHRMWDSGMEAPAYPAYIPPSHELPKGPAPGEKETLISPAPTWNGKGEVETVSSQWGGARMYGSPLIKENGYVALGRPIPPNALDTPSSSYGDLRGAPKQRYAHPPEQFSSSSSSLLASEHSHSSSFHSHLVSSSSLLDTISGGAGSSTFSSDSTSHSSSATSSQTEHPDVLQLQP